MAKIMFCRLRRYFNEIGWGSYWPSASGFQQTAVSNQPKMLTAEG